MTGHDLIKTYEAPILKAPPAYRSSFCARCGSPVPDPSGDSTYIEIAAGTLDDDPGLKPDKHIMVEKKAAWYDIVDALPQFDEAALREYRSKR